MFKIFNLTVANLRATNRWHKRANSPKYSRRSSHEEWIKGTARNGDVEQQVAKLDELAGRSLLQAISSKLTQRDESKRQHSLTRTHTYIQTPKKSYKGLYILPSG